MKIRIYAVTLLIAFAMCSTAFAGQGKTAPARKAIVVAAFGTTYPTALKAITNIQERIAKANPGIPVRLAFTSNIIRKIWQKRAADKKWQKENPGIPAEILHVKTPLATIADLQNAGYTDIAVQTTHLFAGEEFANLTSIVNGLRSINTIKARHTPFTGLALGRPALGMPGDAHPYSDDLKIAAKALASDVAAAKKSNSALVYMGHGNDFYSTGIYIEFQKIMQNMYNWPVFVGCVEGFPTLDEVQAGLKASGKEKVYMKPFMVVAGDHASNDMCGNEDDAWKIILGKAGYKVNCVLKGLGDNNAWADIYVKHLQDAWK